MSGKKIIEGLNDAVEYMRGEDAGSVRCSRCGHEIHRDELRENRGAYATHAPDRCVYHLKAERDAALARVAELEEELETWKSVFPDIAPENVLPNRSLLAQRVAELEKENARLKYAIKSAYGDLWRDTSQHSGLIASARKTLLKFITHSEQCEAIAEAQKRHGPVTDDEILRMDDPR